MLLQKTKYSRKILALSVLVAILAVIYTAAIVFDPQRIHIRAGAYTWLDEKRLGEITALDVTSGSAVTALVKKSGGWVLLRDGAEYPVRTVRVDDLLRLLSMPGIFPVRASEKASQEPLGLAEGTSFRIVVRTGVSDQPVLDLLIGHRDAAGRETYLRKAGQTEIRSGEIDLSPYITGPQSAWLNTRLFPKTLDLGAVQSVVIQPPTPNDDGDASPEGAVKPAPVLLTRIQGGWTVAAPPEGPAEADTTRVENYIRAVLDAEGEDFTAPHPAGDDGSGYAAASVTLTLDDGTVRAIKLGERLDTNRRQAVATGLPFAASLAEWRINSLFAKTSDDFAA
ncbi:MAG: DUF4340 domain-containing protein [Spirochaetaceae bacterium]|jgi:hypothetical protein|nr:DUF4340 domain-containing protein [Spirochaetaceae bacterium]